MKIPLFICLSLCISQSFAMPIVPVPIFVQDFMNQKSKHIMTNNLASTATPQPTSISSESAIPAVRPTKSTTIDSTTIDLQQAKKQINLPQNDQVVPSTTPLNTQQIHLKTTH